MKTVSRLTQAYDEAKIIPFNKDSKYIFFSDTHRGNDSVSDEFTRNQHIFLHALNYYYNRDYTYVEVGDGDELWEHPQFKHIRLAHKDVFKVMKKFYDDDRLLLLYGNHNIYLKSQKYVEENLYCFYDEYEEKDIDLFPGITPHESIVLRSEDTGQEILVLHGHQGDLMNDKLWRVSMFFSRYFWRFMHVVGFKNPSSPAVNLYKRHRVEKRYSKWIEKHKTMLICGHTHRPRFPKHNELPYFNTGCCTNTRGMPGIEIINNEILMVDWRVYADDDGVMHIKRSVVRGPEPLERYEMFSK